MLLCSREQGWEGVGEGEGGVGEQGVLRYHCSSSHARICKCAVLGAGESSGRMFGLFVWCLCTSCVLCGHRSNSAAAKTEVGGQFWVSEV